MKEYPNILNKSKTYLLPFIDQYIKIKFIPKLLNTYLFFNDEYRFCLRYEYSARKEFAEYEKELENNEYYKSTVDISKKEVLYVFDIPEELFNIVDLYISGKYSYLPNKEMMIQFLNKNFGLTSDSKIIKIINRDKELKKYIEDELNIKIPEGQDLSSLPDYDNENFRYIEDDEKEYID